jgi:hypothetical protein
MPKTKSSKESTRIIVPRARRAGTKARRRSTQALASAAFFNPRGELVIRDERLVAGLKKKLKEAGQRNRDVGIVIDVIPPRLPPPPPPPPANSMCGCAIRGFDPKRTVSVVPRKVGGAGSPH